MPDNNTGALETSWVNNETRLNADNMNKMWNAITANGNAIKANGENIATNTKNIETNTANIENLETETLNEINSINKTLNKLADKDVIVRNPSFSFSNSDNNTISKQEVGFNLKPRYEIEYDSGEYKYGPNPTGCEPSVEVTFNGETSTELKYAFDQVIHVTDDTNLTLTAECSYSDGEVPLTNIETEYPEGKIVRNSTTLSRTVSGDRRAFAAGVDSKTLSVSEINSDYLRSKTFLQELGEKSFELKVEKSTVRVIIAFPSKWGSLKTVLDENDSNRNIVNAFGDPTYVDVSGRTAGEDLLQYNLYVLDFASPYGGSGNTYKVTIG